MAFGAGAHDLEFKKNHIATYVFEGFAVVDGKEDVPVLETKPETEVVVPDETVPETSQPEVPAEKGELTVAVEGGTVKSWVVVGDVTAIYIAANNNIPPVLWLSEKVDEATMAVITEALNADADAKVVFGFGDHKIEYQHNKNKTKSVTYSFEDTSASKSASAVDATEVKKNNKNKKNK